MDPDIVDRWNEYRYRTVFHVTHTQFLAEPAETVSWMLEMANIEERVRKRTRG